MLALRYRGSAHWGYFGMSLGFVKLGQTTDAGVTIVCRLHHGTACALRPSYPASMVLREVHSHHHHGGTQDD